MSNLYKESILLIGPSGAGKTAFANALVEELKIPRVDMDTCANAARKNGIRAKIEAQAIQNGLDPTDDFNLFMMDFLKEEIKRLNQPVVSDFGAGHAVFNTEAGLKQAKDILEPFKNIILLLPCKDKDRALQIMKERSKGDIRDNESFINNPSYQSLATITIYADGRVPEEIADLIMKEIDKRNKKEQDMGEIE